MTEKVPYTPLMQDGDIQIVKPENMLRKKIGEDVNIREIINSERVADAQQVIFENRKQFMDWAWHDVLAMEQSLQALVADNGRNPGAAAKLKKLALMLKGQGGTFGYDLVTKVAGSLYQYCEENFKGREEQIIVLRKHIEALTALLHQNIAGNGGEEGAELLTSLRKLTEKYA